MNAGLRWAFNFKDWKPTKEQWKLCLQCVQREEAEKCNRFCFVNDCKASMVGRLLMRKAVYESLHLNYNEIKFDRTSSGKPYLVGQMEDKISFNISHSGNFCVLASELHFLVGIDVMKVEYKSKRPLAEYFHTMRKQFSTSEWDFIAQPGLLEKEQLKRFFRLWCLKESYVKATGTGIAYDLQSLSFFCKTFDLKQGVITTNTQLFKDEIYQKDWTFEETLIDANHCVAVAVNSSLEEDKCSTETNDKCYKLLNFEELMKNSIPFETEVENFWDIFSAKGEKMF